ncbi:MAG: hypothetical protein NVV62_08160 [Terricaulis sp.]|nr:hypothetical protein [Terricaulis sp.]
MRDRRWSLAALALAPVLALTACGQVGQIIERVTGQREEPPGPAPLEAVPLEARAVSGSVQPESDMAALLEPEPLLVAPGEIIVGARVEAALDDAASRLGLASTFVRSLRARGMEALEQLPPATLEQVRTRAEAEASTVARAAALDVLGRLGVGGEVKTRPGGVVTIDLTAGASPTALRFAQELQTAQSEIPTAVEWSAADRCPRVVTQRQLETDLALAMRCAIQRLEAAREFEFVEPNYIASGGFSMLPRRREDAPPPAQQPAPQPQQPSEGATEPAAPTTPAEPVAVRGGMPNDPLLALQWHYRPRGSGEGAIARRGWFCQLLASQLCRHARYPYRCARYRP